MTRKVNLLVGVTGSVAAIKIEEFLDCLYENCKQSNITVESKLVATNSSEQFLRLENHEVIKDEDEIWKTVGDDILHISLRKWADIFIILPLTANTLAKLANGLCDNLLTNVARAWDFEKPIIVCPAMNNYMWSHPITEIQVKTLESFGYHVISPIKKKLACGDYGIGGLENINSIVSYLISIIKSSQ